MKVNTVTHPLDKNEILGSIEITFIKGKWNLEDARDSYNVLRLKDLEVSNEAV